MPRSSWGGGWSSGAERESEASAGGVRAVIRQILEVVPGGILRAGKTIFGAGSGWWIGRDADGAGKVDIGSESRYLRFDGVDLTWRSDHTALEADGTLTAVNGYFSGVLDAPVLDLELMKLCFASISWAQFAVFEAFSDASGRADPDPSSPEAQVTRGRLWNGGDETPARSFGFRSKEYANITTVYAGTSTATGPGYLEDAAGTWFAQQYAGFELVVSSGTVRTLAGSSVSPPRLVFAGSETPAAGAYVVRSQLPTAAVGFLSYADSTNGGYGSVQFQVSFDSGGHWLTLYETGVVDRLGGIVAIAEPGRDYEFRLTLTNDAVGATDGRGAEVYKLLFCTDPSVWS
jgi:hypothetical protein